MKAPVAVGDLIAGRYRVERVIGEGGMGVVVAARHVKLGERVAVKFLLKAALLRPDLIARFLREGRSAAQIRSEHVARVMDAGEIESGEPFLVMEYLEGSDLGALLKAEGPLPLETAVGYGLQVCEALAEMHAIGIVHRDMKPANLFLTRRTDGSPVIKVIDFGISKHPIDADSSPDALVTESIVVMGSPKYMAPEQMRSTKDVDARADIWAMGATLHALMTGAPPFSGLSIMEIYDSILAGAPPLRTRRPEAPAGLEAVVIRCLQRDPAQRYADVAALAAALAEFGPPEGLVAARRAWGILRPSMAGAPMKEPAPRLTPTPVEVVSQAGTDAPVMTAILAPKATRWMPALLAAGAMALGGAALAFWSKAPPHTDVATPAAGSSAAMTATPVATVVVTPATAVPEAPAPAPSSSVQPQPSVARTLVPAPRGTTSAAAPRDRSRSALPAPAPEPTATPSPTSQRAPRPVIF